ncbi:hypothetical protein PMAYCL1PPCAC_01380, partial [Pristionchus mayeri]
ALCTGEKGMGKSGKPLHYKGCPFHMSVPNSYVMGGDITSGDGTGGESIYGEYFEDENFIERHTEAGTLSMVNTGLNTNNSQFLITSNKTNRNDDQSCPELDEQNVVFGRVIEGLDVVSQIEIEGYYGKKCVIADCGQL